MSMREMFKLSFGEEIGNAVSHGVMAIICLILMPIVAVYAYLNHGIIGVVTEAIYLICLFLMFMVSCIYHSMQFGSGQKYVFRKLDHICIFLAIAGTYTPILLLVVQGWLAVVMLVVQWGAVLTGILITSISKKHHKKIEMVLYLVMGWIAILMVPTLISQSSGLFLSFIVIGGVLYTIGIFFYAKKFPYAHFIWHIFIVLASIFHLIAVVLFI